MNPLANESVCEAHTELALAIEELIKYLQPKDNDSSDASTGGFGVPAFLKALDASKHCLGRNSALGTKGFAEGVEIINKLKARERVQEKYCTCPPIDMHRAVGYQARQSCADCGKDMVRNVAARLQADARIAWFRVHADNQESIHNHNAFAEIEWRR